MLLAKLNKNNMRYVLEPFENLYELWGLSCLMCSYERALLSVEPKTHDIR